jgi:hydrogenase maturation protease
VVGVGSLLRADDAVGRVVADAVAALGRDDIEVVSVHQLTPELAPSFAGRELVVFVDAGVDVDAVAVVPLATDGSGRLLTHHLGPAGMLAFAASLGLAPRRAVAISVPVADLGIGTELSPVALGNVEVAVQQVTALVDGELPPVGQ